MNDINKSSGSPPALSDAEIKPESRLVTVSAIDLQGQKLAPLRVVAEDMLFQGLSLLASPPKYGKSWLVLLLCLCVAAGKTFLGHRTHKGGCLYLALEDSYHRLQDRMEKLLNGEKAPEKFDYAIAANDLSGGLLNQLEAYIKDKPDTALIVIDTLQKVRAASSGKESAYSADYREVGALKKFADEHKICLLLVHHLRKAADDLDVFNRISGTNGIMGAADTVMVLSKAKRTDTETTLSITGRDVDSSETVLTFNKALYQWQVIGNAEDRAEEKTKQNYLADPLVDTIKRLLTENPYGWSGTASELFQACIETAGYYPTEGPGGISRKLKPLAPFLYKYDLILYKAPNPNGGAGGRKHTFLNKAERETTPFES